MITSLVVTAVVALAVLGSRFASAQNPSGRMWAGAIAAGGAVLAGLVATSCLSAPYSPWDMVRLAAPMAAVRGFPLYAGRDSGVVLSTMYGPVGMLAFVPAALLSDPANAAIFGRLLAFLFTFGPLAATCLITGDSASFSWRLTVLLLSTFALISLPALRYSATFLHADAPALGLLGLACLLIGSTRPGCNFAAAVACVLAIATKQTLVLLPIALTAAVTWKHGSGTAARWIVFLGIAAVLVVGVLVSTLDLRDLYLNAVSIPAGVPWKGRAPRNLLECLGELGLHAAPMLVAGGFLRFSKSPNLTTPRGPTTSILVIVAFAMIPLAILGRVKQAGDVNSFSLVLYPLLMAIATWVTTIDPAQSFTRLAIVSTLIVSTILGALRLNLETSILSKLRPLDTEFAYLRRHPGEIYLPWHPAAHLAVEGKPTHHLFSTWERGEAGFPVSKEHLLSAMPSQCRFVAFPLKRLGPVVGFGSTVQMLERHGMRVDSDHPVRLAGLPDYECFALTR